MDLRLCARACALGAAALLALALPPAGEAAEMLSGPALAGFIGDMTVEGSMVDSGRYTEFYQADGTIRGDGYTGRWRVDGDRMCFLYGNDPETCLNVSVDGNRVSWIEDGKTVGTGVAIEGNVNGF